MKIVILVGDGMGDFPVDELNGLTSSGCIYTHFTKDCKLRRFEDGSNCTIKFTAWK